MAFCHNKLLEFAHLTHHSLSPLQVNHILIASFSAFVYPHHLGTCFLGISLNHVVRAAT